VTVDILLSRLTDRHLTTLIDGFKREHLDALANRLHEPLQRMLRADLRTSRERSGQMRDGRR
jgi:hypothetical protein